MTNNFQRFLSCDNLGGKTDLTINLFSKISLLSELRKIHFLGENDNSCRVVIPKKFATALQITNGNYVKMELDGKRIVMEKLEQK